MLYCEFNADLCFIINEEQYGDKLISKQQTTELGFKEHPNRHDVICHMIHISYQT